MQEGIITLRVSGILALNFGRGNKYTIRGRSPRCHLRSEEDSTGQNSKTMSSSFKSQGSFSGRSHRHFRWMGLMEQREG
jgi:hypothetical protein